MRCISSAWLHVPPTLRARILLLRRFGMKARGATRARRRRDRGQDARTDLRCHGQAGIRCDNAHLARAASTILVAARAFSRSTG